MREIGRFVIDSFHELELLNEKARARGMTQDVLLRLSPSVDPHTHVMTTTGILDSKFGFSIETGDAATAIRQTLGCVQSQLDRHSLSSGVTDLRAGAVLHRGGRDSDISRAIQGRGADPRGVQPWRRVRHRVPPRPPASIRRRVRRGHNDRDEGPVAPILDSANRRW